jgi:hypothetical protein
LILHRLSGRYRTATQLSGQIEPLHDRPPAGFGSSFFAPFGVRVDATGESHKRLVGRLRKLLEHPVLSLLTAELEFLYLKAAPAINEKGDESQKATGSGPSEEPVYLSNARIFCWPSGKKY